jgi:hypothetical protein
VEDFILVKHFRENITGAATPGTNHLAIGLRSRDTIDHSTLIYLPTLTSVFTLTSTRASEFHQSPCQAVWRCNSVQDESVRKWHNAANPITADDVR